MIVGIPKEIKNHESRVSLTPAGARELTKAGHTVFIQSTAGEESGFADEDYQAVGASILPTIEDVYKKSEMVVKVKEPLEIEYPLIQEGQLLFTYFHFASNRVLTEAMVQRKAICLAYETVEKSDRTLPLLIPMSEVAGRMAVQEGAKYLEKPFKGRGVLLGGVPGVAPGKVLILGGGVVGTQAAKMAAGLGAMVTILDINLQRLRYLSDIMPANVQTLASNEINIRELIKTHDLIIGAILVPGGKTPHLITREMLKDMKPGTVVVDVAVDQGGCIATCRPTTHENPIFIIDGIIHYCVANIPGAVPITSTLALTNATLPYVMQLANQGWKTACINNPALKKGLNIINGSVVYEKVAKAFDLPFLEIDDFMQ